MAPVRRLIITTVEMSRKLTSKFPSGISDTPLATVHTSRSSWTAVITSCSGFKCSQLRHSHSLSFDRHLDEVRRVHLSIVILRAGSPTAHLRNNLGGKRLLAEHVDNVSNRL